jgi:two-component system, NarL family, capsular synthesis sensor histidine kinase RcsC
MSSIPTDKMFFQLNQKALMVVNSKAKRLLLVDDDHATILVVNRMLEALGFWVHAVNSGPAAKDCISQFRYDLLVSDLQMPEIDGYMLSSCLKAKSQDTKAIIMTGVGCDDVAGYMNTGIVDGWLFKPFSLSELRRVIRQCELIPNPNISSFSRANGHPGDARADLHSNQDGTD